ncbi:MAG TPA: ABC transporter substrate-binding protein [Reyranella sp.]|jgi:NitT/TauT family transport system substrate-binding protein
MAPIPSALRLNRRAALLGAAGLGVGSLFTTSPRPASAQTLDKLSFYTDWRAQAEHGGFYQAIAAGLYRKAGIECDLRQGGPNLNTTQLLLAGRVDMIMSGSFEAFNLVREGAPFYTIAAIFQKDPQVLIAHPDTGFDSFEKLKGRTVLIGSGGRVTYWPFLRHKYGLSDSQLRPYTFNMAPFLADKNLVQQGFLTSEPYSIEQAIGKPPAVLLMPTPAFRITRRRSSSRASLPARSMTSSSASSTPRSRAGRSISRAGRRSRRRTR